MIHKALVFGAVVMCVSAANAQSGPSGPWQLTFSDEFNGTSLDTTKWKTQYTWGCTNNPGSELECYQPDDVAVSGGQLHLKAEQRTVVNGGTTFNYTSGMVQSAAAFSQTYGYFEARFKIPTNPPAVGFWPAFWAMPADGSWPPEIDVIELGNSNDTTAACMHVDTSGGWLGSCWSNGTNWSQDYHVWAVYWEPGTMTWYIDGIARQTITNSNIPSKAFYLIANLAVGGYGASPGSTTPFPSYMDVDYIRAWTKGTGSCSTCYATIPGPTDPIPTVTGVSTQAPTVPTNLTATASSSSQINLSWTASTDNVGVTGYKVFRGGAQVGTATGTTYQDTGLTASTSYSYTVSAYDAAGNNSAQTSPVSATTLAASDTQPPTVPTNLTATAVSSSQINLSWTASTDNVGVTGYKVFRGGSQIGTTAGTTYQNTGLTASTSYSYTVSAYDAAGNNSAQTSPVSATTLAGSDTQPPTVPTNLTATAVSSSQINLSWTASTDNVGVTGYKVFRSGSQIGTTAGTTYQNTGLTASTSYSYTVSAYDAAGNNSAQTSPVSATTPASSDTQPPTVPTNLTATAVSSSQINLSWTASTDNVGVTGYKVFRAGAQIGTTAGTTYQDTGLAASTSYSYTVSAYDAAGNNSAQTSPVSATTTSPDTTTYSIWTSTDKPNNVSESDSSRVVLGVKFQASTAGSVSGIRFYKGTKNTGTHIGYLWTGNGALLASATFTGETASGWQQVNFSSPVAIAANTMYVASYYAPSGYYSDDYNYFSGSGVTNGPLTALRDGTNGPNGVYVYSKGGFPTSGYVASNYWVDVVFTPSAQTSDAVLSTQARTGIRQGIPGQTGGASLSCSPRAVQAGSSFNCELQTTDDAQPETAIDSSSSYVMLPAAVAPRANQHSLSFQGSVDDGAAPESATVSGVRSGRETQDTLMTAAASSPVIHVPPQRLVQYGTLIGFKVSAGSSGPAVLSVDNLPASASFDPLTGMFAWTPSSNQQGAYDLTFTAKGPAGSSSKPVHLEVDAGLAVIDNASGFACSPGAIGTLTGKWLGPDEPVADASGSSTELASIRVRVNGAPVPVLYAGQTQISFVCPRGTAGDALQIAVDTAAGSTETLQTTMLAANPMLLSAGNGSQGQISLNGTTQLATVRDVRGAGLPAQPGDVLSIRATGLGDSLPVTVKIGGAPARVLSIVPAADAAGVWEIQAALPAAPDFGDKVPVQLEMATPDGSPLQSNIVTMAIEPVRQ